MKIIIEDGTEKFEIEGFDIETTLTELLKKANYISDYENIKILTNKELNIIGRCD